MSDDEDSGGEGEQGDAQERIANELFEGGDDEADDDDDDARSRMTRAETEAAADLAVEGSEEEDGEWGFWLPLSRFTVNFILVFAGLQLRKSKQNSFHDNFLIFSTKPYDVTLIEIVSPRRFQWVVTT